MRPFPSTFQTVEIVEGEGRCSTPPFLRAVSPFFSALQVFAALLLAAGWVGGVIQMYEIFVIWLRKP